jgi:hypothetical protein
MNAPRIHTIPTRITRRESLALCLLLALATLTTAASAREAKFAAPDSPSCQEAHHDEPTSSPAPAANPAPSTPSIKPSMHSDTVRGGRLQSPRWHSFLPGMFR